MTTLDDRLVALLAERGPMQSYAIIATFPGVNFRLVDAALQRLRKGGRITLLPRIAKQRAYPLWQCAENPHE